MNKNQELEELFDTVATLYLKNMSFLSKNYINLHKKIKDFENLGLESYFLEFVNNHFDIIDKNNKLSYNCNPFSDALHRSESLKHENSFKLISNDILIDKVTYENSINAHEFINEYIQTSSKKETKLSFEKFIFIGTLLGVHLNDIDIKLNSSVYFILEDNLEIFRLSLFLCDYENLNQNSKLFFCIEENEIKKQNLLKEFLTYKYEYNSYIGFEVADERSISNINTITKIFVNNDNLNYPFSEYLCSLKRGYNYFKTSSNGILKLNEKKDFINKPVLFLGSGPSLARYIEWVYLHQDHFYIVCAASTLKRCELLDIIPDMILSADGQKEQVLKHFEVNEKYFKSSLIIASIKTDEEVIKKIQSDNLFFIQDSMELFSNHGIYTGLTVGDTGLKALLNLGAKEIYILGFDASVSNSGKTHDGMYQSRKVKIEKSNILKNSGFNTQEDLIAVKGNFEKEVLTFMLYIQMIESINEITLGLSKNIKLYNLSHGAFFHDINPLKIEEFNTDSFINFDKNLKKDEIKKQLKNICKQKLNNKDLQEIKQELKILKKLIDTKETNFQKKFLKIKSSYKNSITVQIIDKFSNLIKPYSSYHDKKNLEFKHYNKILKVLKITYISLS